jgi:hypothetical protein
VVMKKFRGVWLAAAAIGVGIVVWAVVKSTMGSAPPELTPERKVAILPLEKKVIPVVAEKTAPEIPKMVEPETPVPQHPEPSAVVPPVKEPAPLGTSRATHSSHSVNGKASASAAKIDAEKTAKATVKAGPDFGASLQSAEEEFRKGNLLQAMLLAEKAVQQGAGARGYVQLGKAHLYAEEFDESIRAYKQALKIEPNNAAAQAGLRRAEEQRKP